MYIVGVIMAWQYSLQKGLKLFGKEGKKAAMSELMQLHNMETYYPVHAHELTRQQRIDALSSLIFFTQKQDGRMKGWTCVNRSKQMRWISKDSATSPMVATESVMITAAIEGYELRHEITLDIPWAMWSCSWRVNWLRWWCWWIQNCTDPLSSWHQRMKNYCMFKWRQQCMVYCGEHYRSTWGWYKILRSSGLSSIRMTLVWQIEQSKGLRWQWHGTWMIWRYHIIVK